MNGSEKNESSGKTTPRRVVRQLRRAINALKPILKPKLMEK
ncbi:hypothetical protein RRSWK_00517 [Rhodopirellula sp. SWK7]|nr:hypothetical protein RRSWK_00517 [Rhodopirellula sp. SWK7]